MHILTVRLKDTNYTFGPYATRAAADEALTLVEEHLHQGKALLYRIDHEPANTRSILTLGNNPPTELPAKH